MTVPPPPANRVEGTAILAEKFESFQGEGPLTGQPTAIHDRSIRTDTGWNILLGRGLDIFQRMANSPFDLATKYQKYREIKGFGITYLRDANSADQATKAQLDS
ncbi:MAG: MIT C-terminal domain-containing protein [Haloechinothrix sp.]